MSNEKTFVGYVYDAIADQPVAGAVVYAAHSEKQRQLAEVSDAKLEELSKVPAAELEHHPATQILRECQDILAITKTDAHGRFELSIAREKEIYSIDTIAPRMLPFTVRAFPENESTGEDSDSDSTSDSKTEKANPIVLRNLFHFPSARIRFRLEQPESYTEKFFPPEMYWQELSVNMWPSWNVDREKTFAWSDAFWKCMESHTGSCGFDRSLFWVRNGKEITMGVPAEVPLRLILHQSCGWEPVQFEILAKQGEEIDFGCIELAATKTVNVNVVDTKGNPIPSAKVGVSYAIDVGFRSSYEADYKGTARVQVARDLSGEFGVTNSYDEKNFPCIEANMKVSFEMPADSEREFTICLTDKQIKWLLIEDD